MTVVTMTGRINQVMSGLIAIAADCGARGDSQGKVDAEQRIQYLVRLRANYEAGRRGLPRPSLFVSFSVSSGASHLEVVRGLAAAEGFDVVTGMDCPTDRSVLKSVLRLLRDSTLYLGILTPEYHLQDTEGRRCAPSVWTLEEKGMALALEKPVRLLVDHNVHSDFWRKTTPDKLHSVFGPTDFERKAREAVQALSQRYGELLSSHG